MAELAPGQRLDQYELVAELARSGMATLYRAIDLLLSPGRNSTLEAEEQRPGLGVLNADLRRRCRIEGDGPDGRTRALTDQDGKDQG